MQITECTLFYYKRIYIYYYCLQMFTFYMKFENASLSPKNVLYRKVPDRINREVTLQSMYKKDFLEPFPFRRGIYY